MKLVPYARRWYKIASLRAQGAVTAILAGWGMLTDDMKAVVPIWAVIALALVILAAGMVGSLVKQDSVHGNPK